MASSSLSALSSMRLSGMASGLDTESMVASLMKVERMKYDKLVRQKTKMDWKKDANLEVNNLLRNFRETYLSVLSKDKYMLNSSAIMKYKVDADSTSSAVITAGRDAIVGNHTINSITSLATASSAVSEQSLGTGLSLDTPLSELALTNQLDFSEGDISFKINNQTFTFAATDTLRTIVNAVNGNSDANVRMSFSSLTGKLSITGRTLGSVSAFSIENVTGNAFSEENAAFGIAEGTFINGTDAVLKINGVNVVRDSNAFTIDGITYNLKATTATAVNFNVEQDVDGAVSAVKDFVDSYNKLITSLQEKVDESAYADYYPLTDEEKDAMSEAQIEKWEKLAKSGTLRNDSYLRSLLQDLRRGFYETVSSAGINPSALGLSTVSYETKGLITVDETKLRKAIENNPQQVADALTKVSYAPDAKDKFKESGLAARMQTTINNYIKDYQEYRTEIFNDQYDDLSDSMKRMEDLLQDKEERYWQRFTRMEQALSKMNAQSNWLAQQFASK